MSNDLKFRDDLLDGLNLSDTQRNLVRLLCITQMTISQAAESVGVHSDTARRWLVGEIYPVLGVDGIDEMKTVLLLPRSVDAWLAEYQQRETARHTETVSVFNVRSGKTTRASVDDVTRAHRRK